jgi:hypothetical protein
VENFTNGRFSITLSPMESRRQIETLDELLAPAKHYARFLMRHSGYMTALKV